MSRSSARPSLSSRQADGCRRHRARHRDIERAPGRDGKGIAASVSIWLRPAPAAGRHLHDRRLGVEAFDLEAGDALVVGGDVFQLLQRQHVGDDVVAVGRAFLDHLHHLFRPVAPVEQHEVGGGGPALGLIGHQRGVGRAMRQDLAGEDAGVEDRLRGAVGADRVHRMRGVADQRGQAKCPLRNRIAVDQRIFVGVRTVADQAGHVEPVEFPVLEPGQELVELGGAVVILAPPLVGRRHVPLGDPVDLSACRRHPAACEIG